MIAELAALPPSQVNEELVDKLLDLRSDLAA